MPRNPLLVARERLRYLREPEVEVLDARVEVLLLVGFFQFLALLGRLLHQELPLVSEGSQAGLRRRGRQQGEGLP